MYMFNFLTHISIYACARVTVDVIRARGSVLTRTGGALVNVRLTMDICGNIENEIV